MIQHGRSITYGGGRRYAVTGYEGSPEELLTSMVSSLIKYDKGVFEPRVKWWQFWREKFCAEITAEYIKQTT